MQQNHNQDFVNEFFNFSYPYPQLTEFTQTQLKNNDMKISLQIATKFFLRMQSDSRSNIVSFSCKNYGKSCFEIFAIKRSGKYFIKTDYKKCRHSKNCELQKEAYEYLRIYNLMKLKKDLIQRFMRQNELMQSSPSEILSAISQKQEYFFQNKINYNPEMRRKLRKRFDNIINIDIKKITKTTKDDKILDEINLDFNHNLTPEKERSCCFNVNQNKLNQKTKIDEVQNQEPTPNSKKKQSTQKNKQIKKEAKNKQKRLFQSYKKQTQFNNTEKQNQHNANEMQEQIFFNPHSQFELKEIKQLKSEFNGFQQFLLWGLQEQNEEIVERQTINDKLRESFMLSLGNQLIKKSPETQSISNFPENAQFYEFEQDQI